MITLSELVTVNAAGYAECIRIAHHRLASDEDQHCHFLFRFACLVLLPHWSHCGVFWPLGTSSGKYVASLVAVVKVDIYVAVPGRN